MRQIALENSGPSYTDDNAGLLAVSVSEMFEFKREAGTFDDYMRKVKSLIAR